VRYGSVELPQPLLRGQAQELPAERVETLRREFDLEQGPPPALTLQPVVGQRRASKSTVHVGSERRAQGYVNGHNSADEGRELRRFDHVREDRGRRGQRKPHGGLTVSGEQAAKQSQKPFKQRKDKHSRALPDGNPAAFRSWYVPDGVETGPSGHRNAGERAPKKRFGGNKPQRGPGGGFGGEQKRGPQRQAKPYGHPGNAPSFPSDHAGSGGFNPYGDAQRPRSARPGGPRQNQNRPGGNRPFNAASPPGARPRGPRPGGNRGPRGGGNSGGQR
jgi:23S rRNA pseudouridine2605 synthase